jgi:hypothetical protein
VDGEHPGAAVVEAPSATSTGRRLTARPLNTGTAFKITPSGKTDELAC